MSKLTFFKNNINNLVIVNNSGSVIHCTFPSQSRVLNNGETLVTSNFTVYSSLLIFNGSDDGITNKLIAVASATAMSTFKIIGFVNGVFTITDINSIDEIDIDLDEFESISNISSLVFNNQGDTEFIEYNGQYYNTFPVTIKLVSGVTNFYIKGKEYSVTMNNAGNLKSVQVGSITYTEFPRTITIDSDKTMSISGVDSPTITVNYKNTKIPEVTDT